jgi:hypothetical protein
MKSPAQRQKNLRQRRSESGEYKQLNVWIKSTAFMELENSAKAVRISKIEYLNKILLLQSSHELVTASRTVKEKNISPKNESEPFLPAPVTASQPNSPKPSDNCERSSSPTIQIPLPSKLKVVTTSQNIEHYVDKPAQGSLF